MITDTDTKKILVLTMDRDIGESVIQTVCGLPVPSNFGRNDVENMEFSVDVMAPGRFPEDGESISSAAGYAFVIRFLDVISVNHYRNVYRFLRERSDQPVCFILFREEGQTDFKISCPHCGQKLWIRDQDVGKKARCPNCKKPFLLPSQIDYFKSGSGFSDRVPVYRVERNNRAMFDEAMGFLKGA